MTIAISLAAILTFALAPDFASGQQDDAEDDLPPASAGQDLENDLARRVRRHEAG